MPERVAETVLRYKVDTASIAQVAQSNQAVAGSFASIEQAAKALNLSTEQVAQLNAQLGVTTTAQTQELTKQTYLADRLAQSAQVRANAEAGTLATLRAEAFAQSSGLNIAGIQRNLFNLRQAAIALPGVGYQSPLTVGIRGAELLAGLGPGGLAAAGGIAAVGGALLILSKNAEETRKALKEAAVAFFDVTEAAATQTRADLEERRTSLLALLATQQANADAANAAVDARRRQVGAYADIPFLGELFEPTLAGLRDIATEANDRLSKTQQDVNALNIQLAGTGDTAGDTAARFEELQKQLEKNAETLAERQTAIQLSGLQNQVDAQRMTREEREKEIAALSEYLVVAQQYIDTTNLTEDAHRQISVAMDDARARMNEMTDVTYSFADAAERYARKVEQLQEQFDLYGAAIEEEGRISEKIVEIEKELADARADASEKLAELALKNEDRRLEILADADEKRLELEQKTQDAITKLLRDAGIDQRIAVGERDARAFRQSQLRTAQQIEDQKQQDARQFGQVQKTQDKQLAALQKSQDEQIRTTLRGLEKETRVKQEALDYQNAALFKAQYDSAQIALFGSNNQIAIVSNMWSQMDLIANNGALQIARSFANGLMNGVQGLANILTNPFGTIANFGTPGNPLPSVTGTAALNAQIDSRIAQTIYGGRNYTATQY